MPLCQVLGQSVSSRTLASNHIFGTRPEAILEESRA